jgi:hypothetical protein
MPSITFDGQSLNLDGRRLWIVSGTVPYTRIPRALWASRLLAARQAGLNCIETPVVWSAHEPRPGSFHFEGDLDLVHFLRQVQQHDLHAILRVGPYVGGAYDLGGLPPWLLPACAGKLRSGAVEFMQPVARWTAALAAKVADMQATAGKKVRGPIIAVQSEHQWFCGDPVQGDAYLGELDRYLRENGINVPILGSTNLYHSVEGQVDVWTSPHHLHENLRQLRAVKPDQPRIVIGLPLSDPGHWGRKQPEAVAPRVALRRLAEVLASGGQFNIRPFCGGTAFGFTAGRHDDSPDAFAATAPEPDAPLGEAGERTATYLALRRISTFASQFGRVFASLEPGYQPAVLSLEPAGHVAVRAGKKSGSATGPVAVECRGTQGSVIFVFAPAAEEATAPRHTTIVLSDGSTLPVELGEQAVSWVLMGTFLLGRATLDYCSLNAFAVVGDVFICYGPAGTAGVVSINGSAFEVTVPEGPAPKVEVHEDVTIVICNEQSIDATYFDDNAVYIGVAGLDPAGQPVAHKDYKKLTVVSAKGQVTHPAAPAPVKPPKASLGNWSAAGTDDYVTGTSDRFAAIDGPAPMQSLGSPAGYGWMRLRFKNGPTKAAKAGFFEAADRLHIYSDAALHAIFGRGPGADTGLVQLPFKGKDLTLAVLIDNLGRTSGGSGLGESKGLFGHLWEASPLKVAAPKLESEDPIDPLKFRSPIMGVEEGDMTDARRLTWKIQHRRKTPIFMLVEAFACPALVLLNGEPVHLLARGAWERIMLTPEQLAKSTSTIQIAFIGDAEAAAKIIKPAVHFYEGETNLTAKAAWAFAKWEPPAATKFKPLGKAGVAAANFKGKPAWWRGHFSLPADAPPEAMHLDLAGLTKGQAFLNGHNIGRYWVSTREHKSVPPQSKLYLPESWLKAGADNEITLFDEHGASPEKCRVEGAV